MKTASIVIASAIIVVFVIGGIVTSLLVSAHAVQKSQHQWCQTLTLLTKHPIPKPTDPHANPSRENAYQFYQNLKTLERDFGC